MKLVKPMLIASALTLSVAAAYAASPTAQDLIVKATIKHPHVQSTLPVVRVAAPYALIFPEVSSALLRQQRFQVKILI